MSYKSKVDKETDSSRIQNIFENISHISREIVNKGIKMSSLKCSTNLVSLHEFYSISNMLNSQRLIKGTIKMLVISNMLF